MSKCESDENPNKDQLKCFLLYSDVGAHYFDSIAGSITTVAAIRMTMLCLISTPAAYATLQREIDEAVKNGRISATISNSEAKALPYLQAVIKEGIRVYPPVPGLGSKQVPKGGDIICGYYVPEGTQIGHNTPGMMRSKNIWGEDAEIFRPERWLEADETKLKLMNSVVELNFGSGKYQCMGKTIAFMELNKIFVEVST